MTTLITSTVGPVLVHKNRPVPIQSTLDQMWFKKWPNIGSNTNVVYGFCLNVVAKLYCLFCLWIT